MRILLLRHAAVPGSREGRYLGRTDLPLSDEGILEAGKTGSLSGVRKVYTSPLRRTRETARILFPKARLISVPGLVEMDFGDFEGKTARDMEEDPRYRKWLEDLCQSACPRGEDLPSFQNRVEEAFQAIVHPALREGEPLVALVAHGGSIRAIMHRFADPSKPYFDWQVPLAQGFAIDLDPDLWERESLFSNYRPLADLFSIEV